MTSMRDLYFPTRWVKRVIVESPYASHIERTTEEHKKYAIECMSDCFLRNEAPFASHVLYPQVLNKMTKVARSAGILAGISWGRYAHARVIYTDLGITQGMKNGIQDSLINGIPIIYRSLKKGDYWMSGGWIKNVRPSTQFLMMQRLA